MELMYIPYYIMQVIIQFPSESRQRTGFSKFFIQHIFHSLTIQLLKEYFPMSNLTLLFAN